MMNIMYFKPLHRMKPLRGLWVGGICFSIDMNALTGKLMIHNILMGALLYRYGCTIMGKLIMRNILYVLLFLPVSAAFIPNRNNGTNNPKYAVRRFISIENNITNKPKYAVGVSYP